MITKLPDMVGESVTITKQSRGINTAGKSGIVEEYTAGAFLVNFGDGWQGWYTIDEFALDDETELPPDEIRKVILETATGLVGAFLYYDRKDDEELSLYMVEQAVKDGVITVAEITEAFTTAFKKECQLAVEELL